LQKLRGGCLTLKSLDHVRHFVKDDDHASESTDGTGVSCEGAATDTGGITLVLGGLAGLSLRADIPEVSGSSHPELSL
jgi:hypothetical protein